MGNCANLPYLGLILSLKNGARMNLQAKPFPSALSIISHYGIVCGMVLILLNLLFYLVDIDKETYAGGISLAFMLIICWWSVYDLRSKNSGYITFGQGFKAGVVTLFSGGLISLAYYYLHITRIDPHYLEDMIAYQRNQLLAKGLSEEAIHKSMGFIEYMSRPEIAVLMGSINIIVGTLFFSLISAAIFQKTPRN
jgi:hypothetical protein